MLEAEVNELAGSAVYEGQVVAGHVEETHISWVILAKDHAFKIKKPLKLSFLDFSTLPLRKFYCERELELNSRFTDIYLSVRPIVKKGQQLFIGDHDGDVIDYCVVMKRLAAERRMDIMLREKKVEPVLIRTLAGKVASFHKNASKVYNTFDLIKAKGTFNDILSVAQIVRSRLGPIYFEIISRAISWSNEFLDTHSVRLSSRIREGCQRDVHGDLHTGNIFLYPDPVMFDCIEFNDQFRQIDVLYEVAYLCMDLESNGHKQFAAIFLESYSEHSAVIYASEDRLLFNYFKALRANVRAKVNALSAQQEDNIQESLRHLDETRKYIDLMSGYIGAQSSTQ